MAWTESLLMSSSDPSELSEVSRSQPSSAGRVAGEASGPSQLCAFWALKEQTLPFRTFTKVSHVARIFSFLFQPRNFLLMRMHTK